MAQLPVPLKAKYNPAAYVYGGAAPKVASAIQTQGYRSAYKPGITPPTAPPTAPPAPPAPPSSGSSQAAAASAGAMPGEGIYAQDSAAAYDAYNAAVAASEKDTAGARAQYGFNAEGSNLDPSNSTGLVQRLMHAQSQTSMNDRENALASGLGATGLGAQRMESNDFQNQADMADTTNSYQSLLAAALSRKSDAKTTLSNTLLQARQRQLEMDIQNQMFTAWSRMMDGTDSGDQGDQGNLPSFSQDPYYNPKTKQTVGYRPVARVGQAWMT